MAFAKALLVIASYIFIAVFFYNLLGRRYLLVEENDFWISNGEMTDATASFMSTFWIISLPISLVVFLVKRFVILCSSTSIFLLNLLDRTPIRNAYSNSDRKVHK